MTHLIYFIFYFFENLNDKRIVVELLTRFVIRGVDDLWSFFVMDFVVGLLAI